MLLRCVEQRKTALRRRPSGAAVDTNMFYSRHWQNLPCRSWGKQDSEVMVGMSTHGVKRPSRAPVETVAGT